MRLTILGNGFDKAHGLPTGLTKFRDFLREYYDYEEINDFDPTFTAPQETTILGGDFGVPQEEVARFMDYLVSSSDAEDDKDSLWANLENTLGKLNPGILLDDATEDYDNEGDYDYRRNYSNIENIASGFLPSLIEFSGLFNNWIDSIQLTDVECQPEFYNLLKKFEPCLSFNYTLTAEELYGVENITHIHRICGDRKLMLGHAPCDRIESSNSIYEDAVGYTLDRFHKYLEKDTEEIIRNHSDFFCKDNLSEISEVYTYGFSYSTADIPYMKEIIRQIPSNAGWFIHNFKEEEANVHKKILEDLGFSGEIHFYKEQDLE